ncbi:MAG: HAD family hydrolase [Jiangellaceae bacterium]
MTAILPAAVLWDMDGTLVDTEPDWIVCERALVDTQGGTWTTEDSLGLVGLDLLTAAGHIRERAGLSMTPEQIVAWMVDWMVERVGRSLTWQPGARELLRRLEAAGVPCALVTMSYRRLAEAVVRDLPAGSFTAVVSGDEVEHGKPHPEPYLTAAALLGVEPSECVVIEDTSTGAAAGLAAGCRVLVVPHVVDIDPALDVTIVPSLAGLRPDDLAAVPRRGASPTASTLDGLGRAKFRQMTGAAPRRRR